MERGCCWDPNPLSLYEENYCYYNNPKTDITTVHVVHGCHLDVGFANTSVDIVNLWFDKYFPLAHKVGRALESWTNTSARLKFTAQSWLISLYIDCPSHWEGIHCPSQTALKDFYESVEKEWITWHAFPL